MIPSELHDHYLALIERWEKEATWYKAQLFDSWRTIRGQAKGLKRQARKIKSLQAKLAATSTRSGK